MTVYYHDRSVQVTSAAIEVEGQVYPFDDLARVWHRRDRRSWKAVAGRGMWGLTLLLPVATAIIGFAVAFAFDLSFGARAIIVVAAILIGLSAGPLLDPILGKLDSSFDRGVHLYEIWVERDGAEIRLLQTRDASRFGRIYRAVQRAVES
jgi:hypothetical protein